MRGGLAKFISADGCERIEEMKEIREDVYRICMFPLRFNEEGVDLNKTRCFKRHYRLYGRLTCDMYEYREEIE